jgi:hypothetical protein
VNRRRIAIAAGAVALALAAARTLQYAHRHECPFCGRRAWHLPPGCNLGADEPVETLAGLTFVTCPDCEQDPPATEYQLVRMAR